MGSCHYIYSFHSFIYYMQLLNNECMQSIGWCREYKDNLATINKVSDYGPGILHDFLINEV